MDGTSVEIKDPAAVLSALERAKADAKKFREEKELTVQEVESHKARLGMLQEKIKHDKIIASLSGSGIPNADRLMKYIKSSEINLTDDFELDGLDSQIESLKSDFPELFDPKRVLGGMADGGNSSTADFTLSASEIQAKKIMGK